MDWGRDAQVRFLMVSFGSGSGVPGKGSGVGGLIWVKIDTCTELRLV